VVFCRTTKAGAIEGCCCPFLVRTAGPGGNCKRQATASHAVQAARDSGRPLPNVAQPAVRPTIVESARTGRGALVGVWCVGEPVCPSVRWEQV
jgi:hypothetical protein